MKSDVPDDGIEIVEVHPAEDRSHITKQVYASRLINAESASPLTQEQHTRPCSCSAAADAAAAFSAHRCCGPGPTQVQSAADVIEGELVASQVYASEESATPRFRSKPFTLEQKHPVARSDGPYTEPVTQTLPAGPVRGELHDSSQALVFTPCAGKSQVPFEATPSTPCADQSYAYFQVSLSTPSAGESPLPFDDDLPDDDDADDSCVMRMHASPSPSREPASPAILNADGEARLFSPAYILRKNRIAQLNHGSEQSTKLGFLGEGPFWTCDREAIQSLRQMRQGRNSPSGNLVSSPPSMQADATGPRGSTATSANFTLGSVTSHARQVISSCVDLMAGALNASADTAPPERELTTVLLESQEQRLLWREFLSESVSSAFASNLYCAFDVDAEPPQYARPPISVATVPFQNADASDVVPAVATCEPEKPKVHRIVR